MALGIKPPSIFWSSGSVNFGLLLSDPLLDHGSSSPINFLLEVEPRWVHRLHTQGRRELWEAQGKNWEARPLRAKRAKKLRDHAI